MFPVKSFRYRRWNICQAPEDAYKIKVSFDKQWKLMRSDEMDIFGKLRKIQRALEQAGVPYPLWATKIAPMLKGEFLVIANLIDRNDSLGRKHWRPSSRF